MKRATEIIRKTEYVFIIVLLLGMVCSSFIQVVFRLVLKQPLAWTEELSRYLFVWLTFIGGALVVSESGHFKMDILTVLIKGRWVQIVNIIVNIALVVFSIVLVIYGIKLVHMVYTQKSPALGITMSIPYFVLPLNGVLSIIHLIENTIADLKILLKKQEEVV
ncbi:MAG: TRAP transporter small permease [Sphaerochaeta sp.]